MDAIPDLLATMFSSRFPLVLSLFFFIIFLLYLLMPLFVWYISRDVKVMRRDLAAALSALQAQLQETPVQRIPVRPTAGNSIQVKGYDSIERIDDETARIKATGATYKGRYGYSKARDEWVIQFKDDLKGLPRV